MLRRVQNAISLHELVENILQNVFCVLAVSHSSADEVAKPSLVTIDSFGNTLILLRHHPRFSQRVFHLRL